MPPDARWRFALFYFAYFAALGAYTPYIGRFVAALGHGGYVVGAMLALWYGSRILAPPAWSAVLARSLRPGWWLIAGCALALASFGGFAVVRSALGLLVVMAVFGLFYNAVMPQFEAMTLTALGPNNHLYGRIRVWGSIGFLLAAGSYGALLDRFGDAAFPWLTLPLLAAMLGAAWLHRGEPAAAGPRAGAGTARPRLHLGAARFLAMALLMQMGFGPFYVFFTLHVQAQGHDGTAVGMLWALGVLAEIAMFWQAPALIARFGAVRLMHVCLLATVGRWVLTALYAGSLFVLALAQATHALSFAVFHACCMRQMAEYFPGERMAAGQSLLYGFSSGVGGVLGAVGAAAMWERGGGRWAFLAGAAATLLAWAVHARRTRSPA